MTLCFIVRSEGIGANIYGRKKRMVFDMSIGDSLRGFRDNLVKKKTEERLARAEAEQEELKKKQDEIEAEKKRLLELDNKALLVEAVLAIRGFYQTFSEAQARISELEDSVSELESKLTAMRVSSEETE